MHTLVLNLGNTSLTGGIFSGGRLVRRFRVPAREAVTVAGFARLVAPRLTGPIERAVLGSVVPTLTPKLLRLIERQCRVKLRVLTVDAAHGLTVGYRRPGELGTDRLAAALGARILFPRQNVIVVDCGTATTVTALSATGCVAGGAILPGYGLWAEMLAGRTAQLPRIGGDVPRRALGRGTRDGIASGLHFGHIGAVRELVVRIAGEAFGRKRFVVIGTGGNAARFAGANLFADIVPDLVLLGLHAFAHA